MSAPPPSLQRPRSRDHLSMRDLVPQPSHPHHHDAHVAPHPSQQRGPKLTLAGVSLQPESRIGGDGGNSSGHHPSSHHHHHHHHDATAADTADDSNPWNNSPSRAAFSRPAHAHPPPTVPATSSHHRGRSPSPAAASATSRSKHDRHARLARSPPRTYESQAVARGEASPAASPNRGVPASPSASPSQPLPEPRSEEERFERWKQNIHEFVDAALSPASHHRRNLSAQRHPHEDEEEKQQESSSSSSAYTAPPPARKARQPHVEFNLSTVAATGNFSANGSVRATPSASPHASPARRPSSSSALAASSSATSSTVAPNGVARSLATLHRKVRAGSATRRDQPQPQHQQQHHDARVFDRLYHGLPSHEMGSTNSNARSAANADRAHDQRQSLENIEANFIAKMQSWAPAPAATVGDEPASHQPPSRNPHASPSSGSASSKLRGGVSTPAASSNSTASSASAAVAREEESIRARARALAADVESLQHKKRLAFLAEQAAQMRIQARLQLEEQETIVRSQLERKMSEYREKKDSTVHECLQLQQDLHAKMSLLTIMDENLSRRIAQIESGYSGAMNELQSEYASTMDSLYASAAHQMELDLQQLSAHTNNKPRPTTATTAATDTASTQ